MNVMKIVESVLTYFLTAGKAGATSYALQPVDVVSSGNMKAVTSNAVAGAVSTLARQMPIHGIYQLTLTPRQISTGSELTAIVR